MEKNPISALMEYLVSKRLSPPVYQESKTGEEHKPTFRIKVTADGSEAEGEGFTKQDAKAKACKMLLDILQIGNDFKNVKIPAPRSNNVPAANGIAQQPEILSNSIGDLTQFCQRHHLPEPVYNLIKTRGPAHMKTFTFECSLITLKEIAEANSLKDAKKKAALKILQKLEQEIKSNKFVKKSPPVRDLTFSAKQAMETYEKIRDPFKVAEGTSFKDYHKVYEDVPEKSATLLKFINNRLPDAEPLCLVTTIANELGVKLTVRDMNRSVLKSQLNLSVFLMQLSTTPPISSLGLDEKEAAIKLLDSLVVMCT